MQDDAAIRVLIADDYPVVREGLASIIERCPDIVVAGQAESSPETVVKFRVLQPDVVVIDLKMRFLTGLDAIRSLCGESPGARILVFTALDGDEDIFRALHAGAKGYLLKDTPPARIMDSIRAIHAGKTTIPPDIAAKLAARHGMAKLTSREQDVLRALADGRSNSEIASYLFISEGTVKSHINNILSKMEVKDRTQALIAAAKRGLVHW